MAQVTQKIKKQKRTQNSALPAWNIKRERDTSLNVDVIQG